MGDKASQQIDSGIRMTEPIGRSSVAGRTDRISRLLLKPAVDNGVELLAGGGHSPSSFGSMLSVG